MDISGLGITAVNFGVSIKIAAGAGGTTMAMIGTDSIRLLDVASETSISPTSAW